CAILPSAPRRSYPQLAAELDDSVGGQLEELHRAFRASHHPGEQPFAPQRHAGLLLGGDQLLAAEEEAGAHHVAPRTAGLDANEVRWHVDLVHEAIMKHDSVEAPLSGMHLEPSSRRDVRHLLDLD